MAGPPSYWCYQCNRFVQILDQNNVVCPHCGSGFIEAAEPAAEPTAEVSPPDSRRRSPAWSDSSDSDRRVNLGFRRSRRRSSSRGDRSPYNPVILLRSPNQSSTDDGSDGGGGGGSERLYQLYYDDGAGNGLRPLPPSMSEFLLGPGFDRLLDQLSQLETSRQVNPPASKAAIESMPTVEILSSHICADLTCAVCTEVFALGSEAREMPCKHLYHSDCILPWLSIRNSCPVCRHQLPSETINGSDSEPNQSNNNNTNSTRSRYENEPVGLTIWRLPGGGYAVGRFSGARRGGEGEFPVVYTEVDGGFNGNSNGLPRRIVWGSRRRSGGRANGGMGRILGNFVSFFRRLVTSPPPPSSPTMSLSSSESGSPGNSIPRGRGESASSLFSRYMRRSRRGYAVEEPTAIASW